MFCLTILTRALCCNRRSNFVYRHRIMCRFQICTRIVHRRTSINRFNFSGTLVTGVARSGQSPDEGLQEMGFGHQIGTQKGATFLRLQAKIDFSGTLVTGVARFGQSWDKRLLEMGFEHQICTKKMKYF